MLENKKILSKSSDKNLTRFILNKRLKLLSPINDSNQTKDKMPIDSNSSKNNINIKTNSLLDKNIKIKKNFSVDRKIKPKSNKSLSKYVLKEKIIINCLDENQVKSVKSKEACKSSTKLTIFDIEEASQVLNIDRNKNFFNNQYKRTEHHSNTLKVNKQSELVSKINKFLINKKDSKPTIVSQNNNINGTLQQKVEFNYLVYKNKEKPINNIDLYKYSKEDDKNGPNCEENDNSSGSY